MRDLGTVIDFVAEAIFENVSKKIQFTSNSFINEWLDLSICAAYKEN